MAITIKILHHCKTSIRTKCEWNIFVDQHQYHSKWSKTSGAVIGRVTVREDYIRSKVNSWRQQLEILLHIAELQTQTVYSAYISGLKHKFTFWNTISSLKHYMQPLTLREKCPYSEFFWSVFSQNAGKYGPEKLQMRTLFM